MRILVKGKNIKVAPRKLRAVANVISGKTVFDALKLLRFCDKKEVAKAIAKVLDSGVALAQQQGSKSEDLVIKAICVDKGMVLKRVMPRAQGRAYRIGKKYSHLSITLS